MNRSIIILLSACFAVGGLGVWRVSLRQDAAAARKSWVKYWSYLLIVTVITTLLICLPDYFIIPALLIAVVGLGEILRGVQVNWRQRFPVLIVYLLIATAFIAFCYRNNQTALLTSYTTVVLFDGFSQICGQLLKGPKLAPLVSPDKRLSGTIGGATLAVALMLTAVRSDIGLWLLFIVIAALCGDLLASYIKRRWRIKDYSRLIPGHGGMLDRFDSFMLAGAAAQVVIYFQQLYYYGQRSF